MSGINYLKGIYKIIETETTPRNRNVMGYGNKIPTHHMVIGTNDNPVLQDTRPRRVYAICYSNVASFYILVRGARYFLRELG